MKTLLQKALAVQAALQPGPKANPGRPVERKASIKEERELVLAWVDGRVGVTAVAAALGLNRANAMNGYRFLAVRLREVVSERK